MSKHAIVLGGGFAGLACATALAEAGAEVTVLEKRPHLGGRAYSFKDPRTGEIVDNGQHLFMGCYRETLAFLRRIGTENLLHFPPRVRVDYVDAQGRRDALRCPSFLPAPLHLAWGALGLSGLTLRDKAGLWRLDRAMRALTANGNGRAAGKVVLPARGTERISPLGAAGKVVLPVAGKGRASLPAELDEITVRDWLTSLGQTAGIQERLFDPIAIGALNEHPETASANGFVQVLREIFYRDAESSRLGLAAVGLSDLYTDQSRRFIEARGGKVLLNRKISVLSEFGGRISEVRTERGERCSADAVVSTLPPWALHAVECPKSLAGNLDFWKATPIIGINLWLDRPMIEEPFFGLLGTQIHWVFNKTKLWNKSEGQYLSLVISGAHAHVDKSPQELFELACKDMSACFPGFKKVKINAWTVVKEPQATPTPACHSDALRPGHRSAISNFYFAGDWTQTGLPATIESAVASGHACAKLIWGGSCD